MASACLDALDPKRFRCFSAGEPAEVPEQVHPVALDALRDRGVAQQEPAWPGQPQQALWEYPDLLDGKGKADPQQFMRVLLSLRRRLELLVNLTGRPRKPTCAATCATWPTCPDG